MLLEQVYLLFIYILIFELAIVTGIVIVLLTTILFSYDEKLKFSNSKGFLLQTI